jgi:digeranylgeranylglycerophospholipid reductase
VGGSAAGLFTATLLARKGVKTQVLEQSDRLDPLARTLIVTHKFRQVLGDSLADQAIVNEIRQFELFTDGRSATIGLDKPDLIIERAALIKGLAEEAQGRGVELKFGRRFQNLHANGRGLVVQCESASNGAEEIRADTVVGGDGAASRVAQAAGWPKQETVPLVQAIVDLPKDMSPQTVRVWFIPDDTPYFYWLIPDSEKRGVLGLIGESTANTRKHLERFMEKRYFEPQSFQGARIPLYKKWIPVKRELDGRPVYLVGDAAGQVKVTTIGGIVTGFRGAAGVAEEIANGGSSGELRSLRFELDVHLLLRKALHRFQQPDYSRLVDLLDVQAKRSLGEHSRDDAMKVMWRLFVRQPRLLLMGLRGLLTSGRFPSPRA